MHSLISVSAPSTSFRIIISIISALLHYHVNFCISCNKYFITLTPCKLVNFCTLHCTLYILFLHILMIPIPQKYSLHELSCKVIINLCSLFLHIPITLMQIYALYIFLHILNFSHSSEILTLDLDSHIICF